MSKWKKKFAGQNIQNNLSADLSYLSLKTEGYTSVLLPLAHEGKSGVVFGRTGL
jgi:hypothetical protein